MKTRLHLVPGVFLPLLLATAPARATEIFTNGSFETTASAGAAPAGWTFHSASAAATMQLTSLQAQAGSWSAHVTGRGDLLDTPRQNVSATLNADGSGVRRRCRCWVRLADVASVRVLLRYSDAFGAQPDVILAERVVRTPGEWVLVEGSSVLTWTGALKSATVTIEVLQLSRSVSPLPARLLPDYQVDGFSMDVDADADGLMDRDEPALGFSMTKADTDSDGLPDRWEKDHDFSPAANEGAQDPDDDGSSNVEEYWAATNPRDAGSFPGRPANPNMNAAAKSVLRWLALLPTQAPGRHLAVGQTVTDLASTTEYPAMIDNLAALTGKYPAILSMAIEPPYDRFGVPLQIVEAESRALAYAQAGGLVLLKWAIYNPWTGKNGNDQTLVDLPGLIDPANSAPGAQAANQAAHDTLLGWMSMVGDSLARLQQQGVVVMFRPCSEMNGNWFWWGRRERADYVALWRFLHGYFTTTRGLNNLIWVYESDSGTHAPSAAGAQSFASDYYYPGDDCVDVMTHNLYSATWVLAFDADEIYRRYPKVYGVPQAGPDHTKHDGSFDNLTYVTRSEARLPRSSFFIAWNSFNGADPVTFVKGYRRLAIADNANAFALMNHASVITRDTLPASLARIASPTIVTPPADRTVVHGVSTTFACTASGSAPLSYQWLFNGQPINGATASSYSTGAADASLAGLYSVRVTDAVGATATSAAAILAVTIPTKSAGVASEVGPDIRHLNGNTYDQFLLESASASVTADPGQVLRLSFIDLSDDIVQVEFSGAGTLSVTLADAAGPATPALYHQSVPYMKGHASLVIAGADESTHLSVFSVGRANAFDPTGAFNLLQPISPANDPARNGSPLFHGHAATVYDGVADLAFIAMSSANGKFGGLRTANASYFASEGCTGVHAPSVEFTGPVYIGDISAFDAATPVLMLGSATGETRITGGDLRQDNGRPVQVSGVTHLQFTAGTDSHGNTLPVKTNQARLEVDGIDLTATLVVNPDA